MIRSHKLHWDTQPERDGVITPKARIIASTFNLDISLTPIIGLVNESSN